MNRNTRILIIGYGSVGQRHCKNLRSLGYKNVSVFDVDKRKVKDPSFPQVEKLTVENLKKFQVALICVPNHLHIQVAMQCAKAGCHMFIEKPLSHNLEGVKELIKLCRQKALIVMVGCNFRFHPCFKFIKKYLDQGKLGKIHSMAHESAYYLPYWRPGQDYRKNYAVSRKTGGGIILEDIHEFDLLFWLNSFKKVVESKFLYDKVSKLKIETEDVCVAAFKFQNRMIGSVRCDYLQQSYTRTCKVVGELGNLEWNFSDNIVWLKTKDRQKKLFQAVNYNLNQMYIDELQYYFDCIKKKQDTFNNLKTATYTLTQIIKRK